MNCVARPVDGALSIILGRELILRRTAQSLGAMDRWHDLLVRKWFLTEGPVDRETEEVRLGYYLVVKMPR